MGIQSAEGAAAVSGRGTDASALSYTSISTGAGTAAGFGTDASALSYTSASTAGAGAAGAGAEGSTSGAGSGGGAAFFGDFFPFPFFIFETSLNLHSTPCLDLHVKYTCPFEDND